jgi:predicted membrane metal-binding protein
MTMTDFLTFQTFITPALLIIMYYIGAVFIPIFSWFFLQWIKKVYKTEIENYPPFKKIFIGTTAFLLCFFSLEILWRVIFEFFIAYFDIHDALMKLT